MQCLPFVIKNMYLKKSEMTTIACLIFNKTCVLSGSTEVVQRSILKNLVNLLHDLIFQNSSNIAQKNSNLDMLPLAYFDTILNFML